jgi:hypothetical protein
MKKTILVVLIVALVSTPCFAQEGELIEGTVWEVLPIGLKIFPIPGIWIADDLEFGFYGGKVYRQDISPIEDSSYRDVLGFIVFSSANQLLPTQLIGGGLEPFYFGILQPTGMGIVFVGDISLFPPGLFIKMGLLIKTDRLFSPGRDPAVLVPEG